MLRLFQRQGKTQKEPSKFGETIYADRTLIYATAGTILTTERLCTHRLTIRKVEPHEKLLSQFRLSGAIAASLLDAERRTGEQEMLRTLLATDQPPSHLVEFTLKFHRDQSQKQLMAAALNFRVSGWDTNAIARECGDFLAFIAKDQHQHLDDEGRLVPPPLLTQTKVWVRTFWLTAIFRRYRRFVLGD